MPDKETKNTMQDYAIETRTVLNMLIKLLENDDIVPPYYMQAVTLLDKKYAELENILRKL